ncbi:hypothetical protein NliqN6_5417 [Naganishia liquefaciens]|uniref:F-box domain-containing protein n=1 Tax=Naganishia liquefaciens TaxID=104408 RepID=A0A8H3TXG3_9TREE|nr:hypothetical protein NliqN6_5417 [Naganishia liquefaciens]
MDPLTRLPPELILEVIAHVPLRSLPALRRTSSGWNALIGTHGDVIFRHVAERELRVQAPCQKPDARHNDWKAVCQCAVTQRLMRQGKIATVDHFDFGRDFHPWRIKLDRERQWMFATTREGTEGEGGDEADPQGLLVMDMRTKSIIQRIPEVKQYAHIEYDAGYLVATGPSGSAMTVYKTSLPDQPSSQRETDASTVSSPSPTPPLAFHGTITSQGFRALRLHGMSLLTASTRRIDVFDVVSLQLLQRIEIPAGQILHITYVELDDEYIFVCALGRTEPAQVPVTPGQPLVYVYHRDSQAGTGLYAIIPLISVKNPAYTPVSRQSVLSDPSVILHNPSFQAPMQDAKPLIPAEVQPFELTDPTHGLVPPFRPDFPVACHYGTRHLVILCRNGSVLIVEDYKMTLGLPDNERNAKMFALTLPSNGPDYWNLAVEADLAYITSYHERLFDPWAILVTIDLASLRSHSANSPQKSAEIDIRSWDIPLPLQMSSTHSLQATSEGVYMTIEAVPLQDEPMLAEMSAGWVPPNYRRTAPERSSVLSLRYSRH